jgi:putative holliday junction resolvase
MERLMAIDYGSKRTGLAVSDPAQLIANGLDTVKSSQLISYLKSYFAREAVGLVVIGYPKQMNNLPSDAVRYIDDFIIKFEKSFPGKKYYLMDERFTSKMALQAMIDGGLKKKQRQNKALVDKISATIILQSYMEMKDNSKNFSI